MAKTLEELKAENVEAAPVEESTPQVEEVAEVVEAVETVVEEIEGDAETPEAEATTEDIEDWMQSDEPESQTDHKFTDSDIAAAKKKLKAKLERKHTDETENLKAEIERLKQNQGSGKTLNRPKREEFYDSDDPDEAFAEALMDWKLEQNAAKTATKTTQAEQERKNKAFIDQVSKGVDQHYERALKLSEQSGISPELYQSSDLAVRQTIESIFPNAGDAIADAMISNLGEGSEKVMYSLGVNATKRNRLKELLAEDTSGMKAAMYLGTLKAELNAPSKRKTNAPKPAAQVNGDSNAANDPHKAIKKRYLDADKKGDTQARFDAKMEAKRAGADTSSW